MTAPSSPTWQVLDSGPCDYAFNMALDEALLEAAASAASAVLRFYAWKQPAASFGYFQKIADLESITLLRPLVRRTTGGGLVPHDRDWTYSIIIPPGHDWYELRAPESYERAHRWIQYAFALLGVVTELAPCCRKEVPGQCFVGYERSDGLWSGRKIAGAAQRRTRSGLLIQGSVQPPPPGVSRAAWQEAMLRSGPTGEPLNIGQRQVPAYVAERAAVLAAERYSQDTHNRRR